MTEVPTQDAPDARPEICALRHPVFARCGQISFRRAGSDGTPVMVMPMGDVEVSVPLRSLQREFAIGDESEDGRMLGLIAESLDYVVLVQPGDHFPAEVLTGDASWQVDVAHRTQVTGRLQLQLLDWLALRDAGQDAGTAPPDLATRPDAAGRALLDDDPRMRRRVQIAFEQAAAALGLQHASEVVQLFELLCGELAYIEALRARLLRRVRALAERLHRLGGRRRDGERTQMLIQVQRLIEIGLRAIAARFDEVDAQTGEIMAALRNVQGQQAFIRSNRDWLYRSLRAWEPVLAAWEAHRSGSLDTSTWPLIATTYVFLAPRFRPEREWISNKAARAVQPAKKLVGAVTW